MSEHAYLAAPTASQRPAPQAAPEMLGKPAPETLGGRLNHITAILADAHKVSDHILERVGLPPGKDMLQKEIAAVPGLPGAAMTLTTLAVELRAKLEAIAGSL